MEISEEQEEQEQEEQEQEQEQEQEKKKKSHLSRMENLAHFVGVQSGYSTMSQT